MRELSHRSKNLLAIVLAIARQTSRHTTSFSDFESRFNSRIQALADAHDLLVEQQWSGACHRRSRAGAACRLRHGKGDLPRRAHPARAPKRCRTSRWRCTSSRPTPRNTARCRPRPARSTSTGRAAGAPGERDLRLTWRESGGPPVTAPARRASAASCWSGSRSTRSAKASSSSTRTGWSGPASSPGSMKGGHLVDSRRGRQPAASAGQLGAASRCRHSGRAR